MIDDLSTTPYRTPNERTKVPHETLRTPFYSKTNPLSGFPVLQIPKAAREALQLWLPRIIGDDTYFITCSVVRYVVAATDEIVTVVSGCSPP